MLGLGAIFAVIMYMGSPVFASMSRGGQDLVPVLRSLTLAVLVFPSMSVLRGLFKGLIILNPYAISQIAEQVVRVIWMLLTAFFIMKMSSGDYVDAVTQSTFAAFVGMFAGIAVLIYFLWENDLLDALFGKKPEKVDIDTKDLLIETVKEAIPLSLQVRLFRFLN